MEIEEIEAEIKGIDKLISSLAFKKNALLKLKEEKLKKTQNHSLKIGGGHAN